MPLVPNLDHDAAFFALSDSARSDAASWSDSARKFAVTEIAEPHDMSLPAISKHLRVFWEGSFDRLAEHLERATAQTKSSSAKSTKPRKP